MMQPKKEGWSKYYTLVLVMNAVYIILFFLLMKYYTA
ncbi:hypothetical protein DSL99_2493 [Leeuwenhoekiella marinoflava]|uniref:Uncharacterized protein n=1 Tax=Leeuwenhoekiella marinoflava TaxID=988 RepID=A0A4Q0PKM8_9FLAO|nr:hypothetical protein DSL99_2493 [Leeuwenhoekiella marinoflava]